MIIEACGSAHYGARQIEAVGIEVQLVPPRYVTHLPVMAHWIATAPLDAVNFLGSFPAGVNNGRYGVADFHLGTGYPVPAHDA